MSLAALSLILLAAASNGGGADSASSAARPVSVVRLTAPVAVDGALTEPVWQSAPAATWFRQSDPTEGAAASQRTEVRVAFDDDALYVGARMFDTAPDSIIARLSRRDVSIPADRFAIYLDPYHDKRSGYYFLVNAAGTLFDGTLSNDGWEDDSWDGVWEAKVRRDAQGWTAEMRIPYSQLRFSRGTRHEWGINFRRVIPRRNEEDFLVFQPKKESGFVSRFPVIAGLENIHPGRSIELMPYVTTRGEFLRHAVNDPFNDGSDYKPDGGADLRMGVGSKLTLNATVNPDFGQVEVDPASVNLSDAETFFQEKRPFFVEGSSNFNCGNQGANDYWGFNWPEPNFFYSRRIGRAPQGGVSPNADYVSAPIGASILGAAKLTGKLTPSVNFGSLHALTAREKAEIDVGGVHSHQEIEPLTYYGVMRGLKEFKDRRQGLGLMSTLVARVFDDPRLADQVGRQSLMTAMDGWAFLDQSQTWVVSGWSAMSYLHGTKTQITGVQRNRIHYFQRPDANHVEVDSSATALTGFGSRYWLNKQKGNVICNAALGFMGPGFDVNDMGYLRRADIINGHVGGGYKWTTPTRHRKYHDLIGAAFASYDFQGNPIWGGLWGGGFTEFTNSWSWNYKASWNPQTVNNRSTRGGPLTLNRPGYELFTYFDTDSKRSRFYFIEAGSYRTVAGTWNAWANPGFEWKPASNVSMRLGPGFERVHEEAQYIGGFADTFAIATFGKRYVFSTLDQRTLSANLRLNWAFTPTLSFQLYAQPLISTGDYTDFKQLARPKSYDFTHYLEQGGTYDPTSGVLDPDGPAGPAAAFRVRNPDWGFSGHPDFNYKALRGNAVLRWEYMPGSTLFLAWTQNRDELEPHFGDFELGPSFHRLGQSPADNIFLAKVSYYFSL